MILKERGEERIPGGVGCASTNYSCFNAWFQQLVLKSDLSHLKPAQCEVVGRNPALFQSVIKGRGKFITSLGFLVFFSAKLPYDEWGDKGRRAERIQVVTVRVKSHLGPYQKNEK